MTKRATKRPENFNKPSYWTDAPVPQPAPPTPDDGTADGDRNGLSPTRYGDWEKNGIAIDF